MVPSDQPRASTLEILGAWLHLWTPPRDVRVPPVPWRKLAIWSGVAAVVLGAALAVMVPRIQTSKAEQAAADRAFAARAAVANRARIDRLQAPHHGGAPALLPAAGATAAEVASAREQLVVRLQDSILADARGRAAKGESHPVSGPTTCTAAQGTPKTGPVGVFDCFVVTRAIPASKVNPAGALGYPFRAVVNYDTFAYTWCKAELPPGEKLVKWTKDIAQLPAECQGPKA